MRTLVAVLALALIACSHVSAEEYDDVADYEVLDTNTLVPTETSVPIPSTGMPPAPTSAPSPLPSMTPTIPPTPTDPQAQRYTLMDTTTNMTCLNMSVVLKVVVKDSSQAEVVNVTLANNGQNGMVAEGSTCVQSTKKATVVIIDTSQPTLFKLMMKFNGSEKTWSVEEMGVSYSGVNFSTSASDLDRNAKEISYTRSFKCDTKQELQLSNITANPSQFSANLTISSLQVQVFQFKNNDGQLGSATSCTLDSKQNKIVPIAVGAALAGLVVVVLIAYLIGRLRSRKQSSYEALS